MASQGSELPPLRKRVPGCASGRRAATRGIWRRRRALGASLRGRGVFLCVNFNILLIFYFIIIIISCGFVYSAYLAQRAVLL